MRNSTMSAQLEEAHIKDLKAQIGSLRLKKQMPAEHVDAITNTNLVAVLATASVDFALSVMKEKRFRHLPVVNERGNIVGIVSQKDLDFCAGLDDVTVLDVMSTPVQTIQEKARLKEAVFKILENKISSLLVINEEQKAVGIITTDDLLWHFGSALKDEEKAKESLFNFSNLQLVGEIANRLSLVGI